MGSRKRWGLERLIHRRRSGLFVVPPLEHPVAPGLLTSSDGLARIVDRVRSFWLPSHLFARRQQR
jgi:hypothetical protein